MNCEKLCGTCPWCQAFLFIASKFDAFARTYDTSDLAELVERWANARRLNVFAMAHNKYVTNIDVVRVRIGDELVDLLPLKALAMLVHGMKEPHDADQALAAIREAAI